MNSFSDMLSQAKNIQEKMKEVQDRAHRYCFISNSLSKEVKVKIN